MTVTTQLAGTITDDQSRAVFQDMWKAAEQIADPAAREAKHAEIRAHAIAAGRNVDPPPPVRPEHQFYDNFNQISAVTATPPRDDGYPSAIPQTAIEMFKKTGQTVADEPARAFGKELPEALDRVQKWLNVSAAPAQAKELLHLASNNTLVLRSLLANANAFSRYSAGRPK
jgi:hypothetical protein